MTRAGFQDEPGAYSEYAVRLLFPQAEGVPGRTLRAVFAELWARSLDYVVVPIENSLAGSVLETYDLLAGGGAFSVGEAVVPRRPWSWSPATYPVRLTGPCVPSPSDSSTCRSWSHGPRETSHGSTGSTWKTGIDEPAFKEALEELRGDAASVQVLGSYPRWRA